MSIDPVTMLLLATILKDTDPVIAKAVQEAAQNKVSPQDSYLHPQEHPQQTYPQVAPEHKIRRRSFLLGFNSETESWARGSTKEENTNEQIYSPDVWSEFRLNTQAPIEPGEDRVIRTQAQVIFKPVVIWFEKPLYWEIVDFRIGQASQFVNMNSVLAGAFMDPRFILNFDTAQIAQDISFRIKNISPEASHFRAAILGDSID